MFSGLAAVRAMSRGWGEKRMMLWVGGHGVDGVRLMWWAGCGQCGQSEAWRIGRDVCRASDEVGAADLARLRCVAHGVGTLAGAVRSKFHCGIGTRCHLRRYRQRRHET